MTGLPPVNYDELVEHRGFFPDDNYARICMLQAFVEIEATASYNAISRSSQDPLVKEVFERIMRDEVQHRQYFISFGRGLVATNVYPAKDVLAMAYSWIRPDHGETYGSTRQAQSKRQGFVNWWERVETDEATGIALADEHIRSADVQELKVRSLLSAVRDVTDLDIHTVDQLRKTYFASLKNADVFRARSAVDPGICGEASYP